MAQGVIVDISARVTGYEQSLRQLQEAFKKVNPGTAMGKDIARALENAESKIKNLGKNLTPKITSDTQLERLTDKVNDAGDALSIVNKKMHQISSTDLNFSVIEGLDDLINKLHALEDQLKGATEEKFKELIRTSNELSEAFSSINIDFEKNSMDQTLEELNKKLKEAGSAAQACEKEYSQAMAGINKSNEKIQAMEASPFAQLTSKQDLTKELHGITDSYLAAFKKLREEVTAKLKEQYGNRDDIDDIINSFFGGLNNKNIEEHLNNLVSSLNIGKSKKKGDSKTNFYKQIFGADDSVGYDTKKLVAMLGLPDIEQIQTALTEYVNRLSEGSYGLKGSQKVDLINLITPGDIESATQELISAIPKASDRIQNELKKAKENLVSQTNNADALNSKVQAAREAEQLVSDTLNKTIANKEALTSDVPYDLTFQQMGQGILKTKQQIKETEDSSVKSLQHIGDAVEETSNSFKLGANEVNQYSEEIEKVKAKEQLVGKIEGVVQRWFSVYAAVRMVGNAIRSVISTIKDLDKTITDITIVTSMSREDLWGQMPQYTKMAQDYAVSISGVYQVSQLYYQQGLQTADVMKLSAETLKMARIAGLEYSEATNYMTNALRSFKLEMDEASRVTDAYSALAASAAVSVSEIAEAMSKTASSAQAVGASLENTAAMITVMTEATRESASNIGSALKSIISRYGEMTSDPKKLVDSEGEAMSLNKVDKALRSVGITLQDTQGQFRNFDDVIMELASVWNTLNNNTQRYIATVMAGNRLNMLAVA